MSSPSNGRVEDADIPLLFCICGQKGSGKDTLLDWMKATYGFQSWKLADALKDGVASFYGWDRERLDGRTQKDREWREERDEYWSNVTGRFTSPRTELQNMGDAVKSKGGQDFWIYSMIRRMNLFNVNNHPLPLLVVGDCRYINELSVLEKYYRLVVVYIRRPPLDRPYREFLYNLSLEKEITMAEITSQMKAKYPEEHDSEWQNICIEAGYFSSCKLIKITNSGTLDEYITSIKKCLTTEIIKTN
jgi:hypothetical protein